MAHSNNLSSLRPARCLALLLLIGTVLAAALTLPAFGAAPAPTISGYAATNPRGVPIFSAPPGAPLLIEGANLGSSGTVAFGGIPAPPPASWSPTEILVTVPTAASYPFTGTVTVTTNGQTASGPAFTITPPPPAPGPKIGYHPGDLAPDLTLNNQNDKPVSLSDYAGKSILMTFSAAWCGPCRDAAPREEAVVKTLNEKKEPTQLLEVLVEDPFGDAAIDTDAQDWANQFGLTDPVLQMDGNPNSPGVRQFFTYSDLYGGPAYPTVVLLSPHRRIINVYLGFGPGLVTSIFLSHTAFEPRVMVDWLMTSVERLSLPADLAASLGKPLGGAMQNLDDTHTAGALMQLDAFIQDVNSAVDKGLTADQAAALTRAAQEIETALSSPP